MPAFASMLPPVKVSVSVRVDAVQALVPKRSPLPRPACIQDGSARADRPTDGCGVEALAAPDGYVLDGVTLVANASCTP